jgi:signal transduction histidine kinase
VIRHLSLTQRLGALVALLLLVCGAASIALQMRASEAQAQEAIQRLSLDLARQIADNNHALLAPDGLNDGAVHDLFDKLMGVNPSVEVYLLGPDGRIAAHAAPPGRLRRDRVDLQPLRALQAGAPLPVLGDDPRSDGARKVFSAAPLASDGRERGWVYVVLIGETHEALSRHLTGGSVLRTTLWSMALVAALGLVAGLVALRWITRPLRELTAEVRRFEAGDSAAEPAALVPAPAAEGPTRDEIAQLRQAFGQMTQRIAEQWQALSAQDQQRREMVANISHDLRTPLTSLHGYLETLRLKDETLPAAERRRYLDIAIGQSRKVGLLAQSLFELARLEHGGIKPAKEAFSLGELVQDVFQKFELAAEARRQRLVADIAPALPVVEADLGMIERVLTNLLDNAIRHTPEGGEIEVRLRSAGAGVEVLVSDSGPGVPAALQQSLFTRPAGRIGWRYGPEVAGGLGLLIVRRILQLHGSDIRLDERPGSGAVFRFLLQAA